MQEALFDFWFIITAMTLLFGFGCLAADWALGEKRLIALTFVIISPVIWAGVFSVVKLIIAL